MRCKQKRMSLFFVIAGSFLASQHAIAQNISISESTQDKVTYIDTADKKSFNDSVSDAEAQLLGQSIELQVYKTNEMSSSQTIYESPAGICKGFNAKGVGYTNSTHHYLEPNNKMEYYGSVTGATIYNRKNVQNLSYIPVYSISDKYLSEQIQNKENKTLKEKAINHVSEGKSVLVDVICR